MRDLAKKMGWKIKADRNKRGGKRIRAIRVEDGKEIVMIEDEDLP